MDTLSTIGLSRPMLIKMPMIYIRLCRRKADGVWEAYVGSTSDNTKREDQHFNNMDRNI